MKNWFINRILSHVPLIVILLGCISLFSGETRDVFPFYKWNMFSGGGKSLVSCEPYIYTDGKWRNIMTEREQLANGQGTDLIIGLKTLCEQSLRGSISSLGSLKTLIKPEFRSRPLTLCRFNYSLDKLPKIGKPDEVEKCKKM